MERFYQNINPVSKPVDKDPNRDKQPAIKHSLVDCTKHMLETGHLADLEFIVGANHGDREVIHAHKTFLVMRSPVFETMFCGSVPQPQPVQMPDMKPAAFKHLLQYIYTDIVNLKSVDDAYDLYGAADMYMLPNLSEHCIQYLKDNLSQKNVFRALDFGVFTGNESLKEKCLSLLSHQMRLSYKIDPAGFEVLSGPALLTILQLEDLDMSEKDLFMAVNGWAGRRCTDKNVEITGPNMRKELKKAIIHIRFLAMSPQEFAASQNVVNRVLTDAECMAILMILNGQNNFPLPSSLSANGKVRGRSMNSIFGMGRRFIGDLDSSTESDSSSD